MIYRITLSDERSISMYISIIDQPFFFYQVLQYGCIIPRSCSYNCIVTSGTYEVYVRDSSSCEEYGGSITFVDPALLSLNISETDVTPCNGDTTGSISALASGGTGLENIDNLTLRTS